MVDSRSSHARRAIPQARSWPVPESPVANAHLNRRLDSYNDPAYEFAVYRTKGKPLDRYRFLSYYEDLALPVLGASVPQGGDLEGDGDLVATGSMEFQRASSLQDRLALGHDGFSADVQEAELAASTRIRGFFNFFHFRPYPFVNRIFIFEYFYRNVGWYWFTWWFFYLQEYVYVQLAMYFPILDWLTQFSFFTWSVETELHFWRLALSMAVTLFVVLTVAQYGLGHTSRFERHLSAAHFFILTGSLLLYYRTGFAPVLFFVALTFVIICHYNLFYYLPGVLARANTPLPILALPAPVNPGYPLLAPPVYRYPFLSVVPRSQPSRRPFTSFPFLSVSTWRSQRAAQAWANFPPSIKRGPLTFATRRPSVLGMGYRNSFGYSPYDATEMYRVNRLTDPFPEDAIGFPYIHRFYGRKSVLRQPQFVIRGLAAEPLGIANTAFLDSWTNAPRFAVTRDHFTGLANRDFLRVIRRSPLWQQASVNDEYFRLYLWLRQMAPYYHAEPPQSRFLTYFIDEQKNDSKLQNKLYMTWASVLKVFYSIVTRLSDRLTLGRFVVFPVYEQTPYGFFRTSIALDKLLRRHTFALPSAAFAKATALYALRVRKWFWADLAQGDKSLLRNNHIFRYELAYFLNEVFETLETQNTPSYTFLEPRGALYFDLAVRTLDPLLMYVLYTYPDDYSEDIPNDVELDYIIDLLEKKWQEYNKKK
jgi:hypothetical protein